VRTPDALAPALAALPVAVDVELFNALDAFDARLDPPQPASASTTTTTASP
jgi:hypothetical protein